MKDDYLWDKKGEPDPEIQHLERVLGQLRHRRTAQDLPAFEIKPRIEPRPFSKLLAIAATLAFAVLALGAFIIFQRRSENTQADDARVVMANPAPSQPLIEQSEVPVKEQDASQSQSSSPLITIKTGEANPKPAPLIARRRNLNRSREASINEREQAQGLMAKERLIKALQITSSKLDFVQRKVKGNERPGPSS